MSLPPETIAPVFVSDPDEKSIHIPISIFANEGAQIVDTFILVDSRATDDFINRDLAKKEDINCRDSPNHLKHKMWMEVLIKEE